MAGAALIVANRLPFPLDDGWKVRTWHSIRAVAEHHHVTLVVAESDSPELVTAAATSWGGRVEIVGVPLGTRNSPLRLIKGLVTRKPVQYWNQQSAAAHAIVARLVAEREFSIGMAVTTFMWRYLDSLPKGVPRIVDTHNVDSVNMDRYVTSLGHGPKRWYAARTAANLRHLEREVFAAADQVWVCSDDEAATLAASGVGSPVIVVPNGVDTVRFSPGNSPPEPARLLFFGKLDYFPNHDAVTHCLREILPRIRAAIPEVELQIVGGGASPLLQQEIAKAPGATLVGHVDDIAAAIATAAVVIVPLRAGGGTRLKILEAMAVARPVVSTTIGAEGLGMSDGEELCLTDEPTMFADRVIKLLRDPEGANQLGARGRTAVQQRFDWVGIRSQMGEMLQCVAAGR